MWLVGGRPTVEWWQELKEALKRKKAAWAREIHEGAKAQWLAGRRASGPTYLAEPFPYKFGVAKK